jgi:serine protease Do
MRISILFIALVAGTGVATTLRAQSHRDEARNGLENEFMGQLAAQLRPNGSYLGVRLVEIDADRARTLKLPEERGVEVGDVEDGSPAESAGIKQGDVLLNYNGENILGVQQFVRLVQETPQGRKVKIQFWRNGKTQTVMVTTGTPRSAFEMPPNFVGFTLTSPDARSLFIADIPKTLMVWDNLLFGITCEPLDSQLAQFFGVKRGVLVRSVEKGSAAEKAGMRAGDVLTAIGDRGIGSPRDMSSYLRTEHQSGKAVAVSVLRDHKQLTLSIVPSENQQ